jgi:hypothetical protein
MPKAVQLSADISMQPYAQQGETRVSDILHYPYNLRARQAEESTTRLAIGELY